MVDNTGAIYSANNYTTGQRTKHIDIRTHFVREKIVDGSIKVKFVKSEDNDADIMTKNVSEELFIRHSGKMMQKDWTILYKIKLKNIKRTTNDEKPNWCHNRKDVKICSKSNAYITQ